jgi:hypothetical protein
MKIYKIARARNLILLEEYVNNLISLGYEPIGCIAINPQPVSLDDMYSQAMIKEE